MPSEFIQRQIDRLLAEAADAIGRSDWDLVRDCARNMLRLAPENADAHALIEAADREPGPELSASSVGAAPPPGPTHLSSLPARVGGTMSDASAVPAPPDVGEGLVPSRPGPEIDVPSEGAGETPALPEGLSPTPFPYPLLPPRAPRRCGTWISPSRSCAR